MKKFFLILFVISFCLTIKAEVQLVIKSKTGSDITLALKNKPKIIFKEGNLEVWGEQLLFSFEMDKLAGYTYVGVEDSSIKNIEDDRISSFEMDGDMLIFPSLKEGDAISLYSVNGTIVFNRKVETPGRYSFPISHLDKGVYLIKVNGISYKIVKK